MDETPIPGTSKEANNPNTSAIKRSIFKNSRKLTFKSDSGCDADSSGPGLDLDLTPGSLDVWLELPEEIKHDPVLASFKQLYERNHGKLDKDQKEEDKNLAPNIKHNSGDSENRTFNTTVSQNNTTQEKFLIKQEEEPEVKSKRKKQIDRALRFTKLFSLIACWAFLTLSLLMYSERNDVILHTAVKSNEVKAYDLNHSRSRVKILVTLTGPFLQGSLRDRNVTVLNVWLHRRILVNGTAIGDGQNSSVWSIPLQPDDVLDFSQSSTVFQTVALENSYLSTERDNESTSKFLTTLDGAKNSGVGGDADREGRNHSVTFESQSLKEESRSLKEEVKATLRMNTNSSETVPITLSYLMDPIDQETGVIYATILLCSLYVLIIFEVVNRTLAALLSSSLGVAVLACGGARPTLSELMTWLDVETLLLLFSMMLLVAILAETGLFDYLAVLAFELTGGRTWPLINCLCIFTAVFSTFLDNVTTVLLMTPVTIRLCEVMQLNPIPVLMSMVIFSNVGGSATPVGDPPNVIIATHPSILNEGINFATFSIHMGIGIMLVSIQTYLQLRYMYRDMNKLRHTIPQDIIELRQEILVWRRAAASLSSYSRDEDLVRKALEKKVEKLSTQLRRREAGGGSRTDPSFCTTLADMKEKYRIRDKPLLIKSTICVTFVVVVFFLHAIPQLQRLSLSWTALLGALLLLLLAEREDLEPILARVEWSTLLFFAALFVLMESLSKLGLIAWIGNLTESIILKVQPESRLAVAILLILWVSGIVSAFVDNIPLTTMMVRVMAAMADPAGLALPLAPLAWALSFGACLGGNGTLIGASANVVCAGVAEQHGYRFTFIDFLKVGFPVMIGNLSVATVYLMICHVYFTWH